jgi:hypothetical protein
VPPEYRDLIEALCTLQQLTGSTFPVPKELTNHDALAVESAIRLLRGETVAMPWSSISIGIASTFDALQNFPAALRVELPDYEIEIGGHRVGLGGARL